MSNIQITNIDENFPIAGQDNDSQGFRDNFNELKTNLGIAKTEITNLENNTAKVNVDNNFSYNEIQNAVFYRTTEKFLSKAASGSTTVTWSTGSYQKITVTQDLSLTLDSWPNAGQYAKLIAHVVSDGEGNHTITWASTQGNNIKADSSFPRLDGELKFQIESAVNPKIFEFWTTDGGATIFAKYLGEFS